MLICSSTGRTSVGVRCCARKLTSVQSFFWRQSSAHQNPDPVDAARMSGAWYVVQSNLDVWKSRVCPVVIYEPMPTTAKEKEKAAKANKPEPAQVRDITEFRSGSTLEKQAEACSYYYGVDTQMNPGADGSQWHWQGTGFLFALTSDWQMVKHDAEYTWSACHLTSALGGLGQSS
jgi:hypothetical protein